MKCYMLKYVDDFDEGHERQWSSLRDYCKERGINPKSPPQEYMDYEYQYLQFAANFLSCFDLSDMYFDDYVYQYGTGREKRYIVNASTKKLLFGLDRIKKFDLDSEVFPQQKVGTLLEALIAIQADLRCLIDMNIVHKDKIAYLETGSSGLFFLVGIPDEIKIETLLEGTNLFFCEDQGPIGGVFYRENDPDNVERLKEMFED